MDQHTDLKARFEQEGFVVLRGLLEPAEISHFYNHYNYYRYLRGDLGYQALHPALVERLKSAQLYAGEQNTIDRIEGAWLPSKTFVAVARHFK